MNQNKGTATVYGCFLILLRYLLGVVAAIGLFYLFNSVTNLVTQNQSLQSKASISLNEIISSEAEFPENEYVKFEARWVIGPYATSTKTNSLSLLGSSSSIAQTDTTEYYYYAILEDNTIMSIATINEQEAATLDRMSEWLLNVDGFPTDGETITLQGKLSTLKDKELIGFYNENLSFFGATADSPYIRYLVLNTNAGRDHVYVIIIAAIVLITLCTVLYRKHKRKKEEAARAAASEQTMAYENPFENPNSF